ncbi:hypothetical protein BC749_101623 [Flavobacterium araucananum]|nr:hypothetical protein BC749_101623 [Flavobacterium araucananum]
MFLLCLFFIKMRVKAKCKTNYHTDPNNKCVFYIYKQIIMLNFKMTILQNDFLLLI